MLPVLIVLLLMAGALGQLLVPVVARALVSGRVGLGVSVLGLFVLALMCAPVRSAVPPPGATAIGVRAATVACTPGALVYFGFMYADWGVFDGVCPSGATVSCGYNSALPSNGAAPGTVQDGSCWEVFPTAGTGGSGGGASSPAGGGSSVQLELSPSLYAALGVLGLGAILFLRRPT